MCVHAGLMALATLLVSSCGGGGSSGPAAPSALSYPTAPAFVINQQINSLQPTVTGTVTGYSVSPTLPAGLSIAASSGVISGTPSAVTPKTMYTVTATGPGGNTTAQVSLTVNDVAPSTSYRSAYYSFSVGVAGSVAAPAASGGKVTSWAISPALPDGLSLSTTDGSISGTPTAATPAVTYQVTATNSGGQSTATFVIAVGNGVLLDLGHVNYIDQMKTNGTQLLSHDMGGRWILWNTLSQGIIASGTECQSPPCNDGRDHLGWPVDIAGTTVVIQTAAGFDARAATDGHLLSRIASVAPTWWLLSSDGSYLCAGGASGLQAWSTSGTPLFSRSGDYSKASAVAVSGQILLALGPAGANNIETVAANTGISVTGPGFSGAFLHWFSDGGRYLTSDANANRIYVYSNLSVQQDAIVPNGSLANDVHGQGNFFWSYDGSANVVSVYTVGASSTAAATFGAFGASTKFVPSGLTLGILGETYGSAEQSAASVVDLSGATPTMVQYALPFPQSPEAFAAQTASQWFVGAGHGVVFDGSPLPAAAPKLFGYGAAVAIAGGTHYFAVSTASGQLLYFDAATNSKLGVLQQTGDISSTYAPGIAMSTDGTTLAVGVPAVQGASSAVDIYAMPGGSLTASSSFGNGNNGSSVLIAFSLSGSGSFIGTYTSTSPNMSEFASSGGAALSSVSFPQPGADFVPPWLTPDGSYFAVTFVPQAEGLPVSTSIYKSNGTLSASRSGMAIGWLDNQRLLVDNYNGNKVPGYVNTSIYDPTGALIASPSLPQLNGYQVVDAAQPTPNLIYAPQYNAIYSVSSGAVTWSSASPYGGVGAVSGKSVVFESGSLLVAEPDGN